MSEESGKKQIRDLREAAGMTQMDLAVQMGVTIATVSNWERGTSEPFARHLLKLARLFNVSPFDIVLPEIEKPKRGKAAA
jgi:transcriptional regulator with XRE-family HTH domain